MTVGVSPAHEQLRAVTLQALDAWNAFIQYIELPEASVYWNSCRAAWHDLGAATSSFGQLAYLTFRPIFLILWLLFNHLFVFLQFVSKHLFKHGYVSAGKGWVQVKWAAKECWKWQRSLSRTAVLIELAIVVALIGCYMLRRYIQRRQYVKRATAWYQRKKLSVRLSYRRGVRRIAQTSFFLAMLMPHAVFLASIAASKLLVPRLLTWLATDTYFTSILSFLYPFVWTIGLLQYHRNGHSTPVERQQQQPPVNQVHETPRRSNLFPRTTPTLSRSVQRWLREKATPVRRAAGRDVDYDINEEATYWIQYWVVYATFLATCRLTYLLPIVGRILAKYALLSTTLRELQLVFFLWIFGVPMVTPELTNDTKPLSLLYTRASPVLTKTFNVVSNAIPETLWQSVVQKVQSLLDVVVLVKLISTETKDWLVHVLEESRPLLPPAVSLLMPGFMTQYGVVYVESLVPCAKSCKSATLDEKMSWLEYWVLHGLVSAFLKWWAPLLWWVPFSTHGTFLLWCNLQIPKTTRKWYNLFEEELQAFGLLDKGDKDLQVERTVTASVLRTLASSLPSGVDENESETTPTDSEEKEETVGQRDTVAERKNGSPRAESEVIDMHNDVSMDENEESTPNNANRPTRRRSTRVRSRKATT